MTKHQCDRCGAELKRGEGAVVQVGPWRPDLIIISGDEQTAELCMSCGTRLGLWVHNRRPEEAAKAFEFLRDDLREALNEGTVFMVAVEKMAYENRRLSTWAATASDESLRARQEVEELKRQLTVARSAKPKRRKARR